MNKTLLQLQVDRAMVNAPPVEFAPSDSASAACTVFCDKPSDLEYILDYVGVPLGDIRELTFREQEHYLTAIRNHIPIRFGVTFTRVWDIGYDLYCFCQLYFRWKTGPVVP